MSGTPLSQLRRPNAVEAVSILRQVAQALDGAHRTGRVHGSLTAADIIVRGESDSPAVQIANFGQQKLAVQDLTSQEQPAEPAHYMSREQILGTGTDERVDEYALGVIAYELLTGKKPFTADTLSALFYQICTSEPEPPHQANAPLPQAASEVLNRALAKNPEERFATCKEFVDALGAALNVPAEPATATAAASVPLAFAAAVGDSGSNPPRPSAPVGSETTSAPPPAPFPPGFDLPPARKPRRLYEEKEPTKPIERSTRSPVMRFGVIAALIIFSVGLLVFLFRPTVRPNVPTQVLDPNAGPVSPAPGEPAQSPEKSTVPETTPATGSAQSALPKTSPSPARALRNKPEDRVAIGPLTASVDLVSEPPGARIVIDNRRDTICTAPCTMSLSSGRHTLSAQMSGYGTAQRIFNVPDDRSVVVALGQQAGTLLLTSVPSGSMIMIDGKPYGHTPATVHLAPGSHKLQLRNGARTHEETLEIEADALASRNFTWQQ